MSEDKYEGLTVDFIDRPLPESHPDFAMRIGWSCPGFGFGTVDFIWRGNELHAYTECMGRAFLERLMKLVIEKVVIE